MRTLIVSGDADAGALVESAARSLGHEVSICRNADTALSLFGGNPFPIVIVERDLPGTSGMELMEKIRLLPDGGTSVMLIITSRKDEDDLRDCLNAGADDYIVSPYDENTLKTRLMIAERTVLSLWDRKIFEESMRSNEERFRSVVETANDAIICVNSQFEIIYWNPAAQRIFGYGADEIIGRQVSTIVPAYLKEKHDTGVGRVLSSGDAVVETGTVELTALKKDGTEFAVELSRALWRTEKGIFFTGIIRDISERKKAERVKEEFCSVVSHELKTPLTAIRGSLGLLLGGAAGELGQETERLVKIAYANCERLIPLINDIMDMERLETGRMQYDMKPVNVASLVEQAMEANSALAEQFGVQLKTGEIISDAVVTGDGLRLIQVLTNLVSNAVKYSPEGDAVTLSVSRSDGSIKVSVLDRGPGVPEEFRPKLFQKFAQADSKDTRRKGGTGLGLSICKAIVERHSGRIGYSRGGQGTEFYFILPEYLESLPEFKVPGAHVAVPFYEALEAECKRAYNGGQPLSLIMIGIDSMRGKSRENREIAGMIALAIEKAVMRSGDRVLPYTEGELAIILPETDGKGALSVAERARSLVETLDIARPGFTKGPLTVSLGVATNIPTVKSTPDEFVNKASQALYKAMREGGNRVETSDRDRL